MKITGTFLDEISHDIPHQNWGEKEWRKDFAAMKSIGIDTVILIRCGHRRFIAYPSEYLMRNEGCYAPPVDLVGMFLRLAEEFGMKFFFGLYDSGKYWQQHDCRKELEISRQVAREVWRKYGRSPAWGGWYLNFEVSRAFAGITELYAGMGQFVKELSGGLPTLISPYIDGVKPAMASAEPGTVNQGLSIEQHEREWNQILGDIQGAVDILAFQDGHCDYHELADYLRVNQKLARRHDMACWTNCESFDRDMPIHFLPIKWEKMLLKLEAARQAGMEKAITFEFSHFMSPNSMYPTAGNLFRRYCEYFDISAASLDKQLA